ncbi:CDK-activating kinase assembly factor MAT1-like [Ptychodera flava]|uniref:CDK-activating kinase assembly factor MAT1-like n=1 Tax=Ptychodera flava TaxID=63121 RepID=UPI003969E6B7
MDDQFCPHCKTTKYRNPSLKLLVNVCGHSLCENCVDLLFVRGSGACPQCNTALRRNNFRLQLFEDAVVEKEVDIRKRILKDFNKKEEDFATLREYNDYLEEVETIIYNLANGIDVEASKRKVEEYRRANKDSIVKNKGKLSKDETYLEALIEQEQQEEEEKKQMYKMLDMEQKNMKKKNKEALIDDLMFSDMRAADIIASHAAKVKQQSSTESNIPKPATKFSTGIKVGFRVEDTFLPIPVLEETLYRYQAVSVETYGPPPPEKEDLETQGYLRHVRPTSPQGLGGGYSSSFACHRALQEAFCGLFFTPEISPSPAPSFTSTDSNEMMDAS